MMKHSVFTFLAAAAISTSVVAAPAIFTPAAAQVGVSITVGTPPPAPIYEVVPAPRAGYAWAPGYWRWENERHIWAPGRWIEARHGHHWVADRWVRVEGPHGGWRHEMGHWNHG